MSPMATGFLGIDLGTSNSVAVLSDGDKQTFVRTPEGGSLLPSVVRIDARGHETVGARARRFLETDPENTRAEFKRLMGTDRKLAFKAANVSKSPEQLSSMVLATLRGFAAQSLGHLPSSVVVTVPALFELPQIRATSEAARLAGFERVEHLQEPVASALTAGWDRQDDPTPWLVYDLGGGTFDVSLVETREGVLRVVGHDGDNFLGGRDMDARLLEHVLAKLSKDLGRTLGRADPALAGLVRKLRSACEEAKIELGSNKPASVSLVEPLFGEEVVVDVEITPEELDAMVLPLIDKSIDVCLRLLSTQGVEPRSLGRIVLVGGPTVMTCLRLRLKERLGVELATDVDPMTAVAEGAARFAVEHGLTTEPTVARSIVAKSPDAKAKIPVWLQYPGVSGDLSPFVVGKAEPGKLSSVRLVREGGGFETADEPVADDGSFAVQVELRARTASTFKVTGRDKSNKPVELEPSTLSIRHGLSLADPPLSRTIGVALANDKVAVYFERGAPLPSRKSFPLRTALTIKPGQKESAISVPIVQGEVHLAHLCRLVGTIEIRPESLTESLPAGSRVDVVLELDRGGKLSATAHLPDRNVSFPGSLVLVSPDAPLSELEDRLSRLRTTTEEFYRDPTVGDAGRKKLVEIDGQIEDAIREAEAARGADPDAIEKLRRLLIDADAALSEVNALRAWPELLDRALNAVGFAVEWVSRTGTATERRALDETVKSLERARAMKNASEFDKRIGNVLRLGEAAWLRDPNQLSGLFRGYAARLGEMRDPKAARNHITTGEAAIGRGDWDTLRTATYALLDLLPADEHVRISAHGSGVER